MCVCSFTHSWTLHSVLIAQVSNLSIPIDTESVPYGAHVTKIFIQAFLNFFTLFFFIWLLSYAVIQNFHLYERRGVKDDTRWQLVMRLRVTSSCRCYAPPSWRHLKGYWKVWDWDIALNVNIIFNGKLIGSEEVCRVFHCHYSVQFWFQRVDISAIAMKIPV